MGKSVSGGAMKKRTMGKMGMAEALTAHRYYSAVWDEGGMARKVKAGKMKGQNRNESIVAFQPFSTSKESPKKGGSKSGSVFLRRGDGNR
jgi:hypothetical protein